MKRTAVITLLGCEREDGTVQITSPDIKPFAVVGKNEKAALDIALQVLTEQLEMNSDGKKFTLTLADSIKSMLDGNCHYTYRQA